MIHRLDRRISKEEVEELSKEKFNLPSLKLLLTDHRVSLGNLRRQTKHRTILELLSLAEEARKKTPWTLRRISTLKGLSFSQQYQLMKNLEAEGKLDSRLSQLLKNQDFIDAYLADNAMLSQMLSRKNYETRPNVNHAAAAALYADDLVTFNSLVPHSSQFPI